MKTREEKLGNWYVQRDGEYHVFTENGWTLCENYDEFISELSRLESFLNQN
jgi:hypothetical protein